MRGATAPSGCWSLSPWDFNPRAPCGARQDGVVVPLLDDGISIHAPHAGRDWGLYTPWLREMISIHAPHAGRDARWYRRRRPDAHYFNPRAPCGARLRLMAVCPERIRFQSTRPMRGATESAARRRKTLRFQSTRPMRGATPGDDALLKLLHISIHAPHAGRDSKSIQNYFTHFCDKRQFLDNFTQNAAF